MCEPYQCQTINRLERITMLDYLAEEYFKAFKVAPARADYLWRAYQIQRQFEIRRTEKEFSNGDES